MLRPPRLADPLLAIVLAKSTADIQRCAMKRLGRIGFKWLGLVLASLVLCSGCSILPPFNKMLPGNHAFIRLLATGSK